MIIKDVTLFNFCQFEKLHYDLTDGITRVYAPNGAGKTNFLRGITYALTGWCDPSWGTQSDLQKDGTSSPGYAQVTLDIDGIDYTLRRYVTAGSKTADSLSCEDPKLYIEKRQRVNAFLEEHLPVTLPILAQLMWLRQGGLVWLLTATTASINAFLGLIFDTKKLEKLREVLKLVISQIADIRGDQEPKIQHWKEVLETMPDIEGLEKELADLNATYMELATYSGKMILRESDQKKKLEELQGPISLQSKKVQDLEAAIEANMAYLHEIPGNISMLQAVQKKQQAQTSLEETEKFHKESEEQIKALKEVLRKLDNLKNPVCDYCGSKVTNGKAYRDRRAREITGMDTGTYEDIKNVLEMSLKELEGDFPELEKNLEKAKKALNKAEILYKAVQENEVFKAEIVNLQKKHMEEDPKLRELQAKKQQILEAVIIGDSEESLQTKLYNIKQTIQTVNQCLSDARSNKAVAETSIAALEKEKKEHELNTKAKKLFTHTRDVLSQSRAQTRYLNGKLDTLNSYIEHYLALSEMPFILKLDKKDHLFKYHMIDSEQEHPAGMLSGAQQAAAAIAVQMAIVETAFPELSLLLVDEADAALSPENKFIAARLYRTLANNMNGSVLVISQSEDVSNDCDNTWELPT